MMVDLPFKATQERYFNSIRYFAHTLSKSQRTEFILQLAEINIYLAAQCAMTGEEDLDLESKLLNLAENNAKEFTQPELSAQGFLALAEFEKFEIILSLLTSVKLVRNIHHKIIYHILSSNNEQVFYKFLEILIETEEPNLIQSAISAYNGSVHLDSSNKHIFQKLISKFEKDKHYGTMRIMLSKFNILDELEYILNQSIESIIEKYLRAAKFSATNLCYELAVSNNLLHKFSTDFFIKHYIRHVGAKGLISAISIADKYNSGKNSLIDNEVESRFFIDYKVLTNKQRRKRLNDLKIFLRKGGSNYLKTFNPSLYNGAQVLLLEFDTYQLEDYYKQGLVQSEISFLGNSRLNSEFDDLVNRVKTDLSVDNSNVKFIILSLLFEYFQNPGNLTFESIIILTLRKFNITLKIIKHALHFFSFTANVAEISKYGLYLNCDRIIISKRLFLAKKIYLQSLSLELYEKLKVDDEISIVIRDLNISRFVLEIEPTEQKGKKIKHFF